MKTKYLLTSLILSAGLLVACNGGNNGGGSGSSDKANLDYSEEQAKQKTMELANNEGFEVTIHAESSSTDPEDEDTNEDFSFGYTSEIFWGKEYGAFKKVEGGVEIYQYDEETNTYVGGVVSTEIQYDDTFGVASTYLFNVYTYVGTGTFELSNKHDITFLGRSATEYKMGYGAYGAVVSWTVVVDKDTGMTLKVAVSGSNAGGEGGAASFEVTSLKIGSQVTLPNLVKDL